MEKWSRFRSLVVCLFVLAACGVKGPLQPPLQLVPNPPEKVVVSQQGTRVRLSWETPLFYENGVAMSSWPVVEVWGLIWPVTSGPEEFPGLNSKEFEKKRKLLAEVKEEEKETGVTLPASLNQSWEFLFKEDELERFVFSSCLRVRDSRGRKSSFSQPITIIPVRVPNPPRNLRFSLKEDGVWLQWESEDEMLASGKELAATAFLVYRKESNSAWKRLTDNPVEANSYEDKTAILKRVYFYRVTAVRLVDSIPRESEASATLEVTFKDVFPPPPPSGVAVVIGEAAVVLSWEPSAAADLAGYRLWRRSNDEDAFRLLTPAPILLTSYEDRQVAKGKSYRYAITAVDQEGNESRRTEIETGIIKGSKDENISLLGRWKRTLRSAKRGIAFSPAGLCF